MTIEPHGRKRPSFPSPPRRVAATSTRKAAKRAERQVGLLFLGSGLASVALHRRLHRRRPIEEVDLASRASADTNASNLLLGHL